MWYERACKIAGRYLHWIPGEVVKDDFGDYLKFTELRVEKADADALAKSGALLSTLLILLTAWIFSIKGLPWFPVLYLIILVPPLVLLFLRDYLKYYATVYRVKIMGAMPEMTNNMALALKVKPNLENALEYAAERTHGPVGEELRKMVWEVHMREHTSADKALEKFAEDWKQWNKDFSTAIHYLRGSLLEKREEKRISMIDRGMDVVLSGASQRMMDFAASLELPTTMLYFVGVLLPLILIALLPTFSYVGVSIGIPEIFLAYCILLPCLVYLWTKRILEKRPLSFPAPVIPDEHPGFPPKGKILLFGRALPVLIIPILGIGLAAPGLLDLEWKIPLLDKTIFILWGLTLGVSMYLWLTTQHKAKLRDEIKEMEEDLAEALRHLESRLAEARPMEEALAYVGELMSDKRIGALFCEVSKATANEQKPLRSILLGEKGPLRLMHNNLIHGCLRIVDESARKSNAAAAAILSRITAHLESLRGVEVKIMERLGSTVDTMYATMIFFAPFIAGVVVVLQDLMNRQLAKGRGMDWMTSFDPKFQSHFGVDMTGVSGLAGLLHGTAEPISMGVLQLILGIYMMEMNAILTLYIEEIRSGDDAVVKRMALSKNLPTGMIIFTISIALSNFFLSMFA